MSDTGFTDFWTGVLTGVGLGTAIIVALLLCVVWWEDRKLPPRSLRLTEDEFTGGDL